MASAFYDVGRYACKVTSQALGEAKTGTPQFVLQFTVLGKVDPSDPTRYLPAPAQYQRTHCHCLGGLKPSPSGDGFSERAAD
jgi:hypothetical protein